MKTRMGKQLVNSREIVTEEPDAAAKSKALPGDPLQGLVTLLSRCAPPRPGLRLPSAHGCPARKDELGGVAHNAPAVHRAPAPPGRCKPDSCTVAVCYRGHPIQTVHKRSRPHPRRSPSHCQLLVPGHSQHCQLGRKYNNPCNSLSFALTFLCSCGHMSSSRHGPQP